MRLKSLTMRTLAKHNSRGTYMRDDHCDWGSSGMQDLVETLKESN